MLTADQLRETLDYNAKTGIFQWREGHGKPGNLGGQAGTRKKSGQIHIMIQGKKYLAHRLAFLWMTGEWPKAQVDHRDCKPSNNRWKNLREATHSQNEMNKGLRLDNTSGFKGVSYHKRFRKWSAKISQDGRRRNLGWFDTAEEAYDAHCKAARELYGEYARLRELPGGANPDLLLAPGRRKR